MSLAQGNPRSPESQIQGALDPQLSAVYVKRLPGDTDPGNLFQELQAPGFAAGLTENPVRVSRVPAAEPGDKP